MEHDSPALAAFISAFNFRRRLAWALGIAALVLGLIGSHLPLPYPYGNWLVWGVVGAAIGYNFFFAKCPECRRFIGVTPWRLQGLPRGFRCELELACKDVLDDDRE